MTDLTQDLLATADRPEIEFIGAAECQRLRRNYERRRVAYRKRYPHRTSNLTGDELYLAPADLRLPLPGYTP